MTESLFPYFEKEFKRLDILIAHTSDPFWISEKALLQKKFDEYVAETRCISTNRTER